MPTCGSDDVVKHEQSKEGKQRYKCRNSNCERCTLIREYAYRGYLPEVKQQIVDMAINGSGTRDTARVLKISRTTVTETLNTHKIASLYEAFAPTTARRLAERLEIHYTPKYGSWLNIAENELSALTRQCLNRRIPDFQTLEHETTAWYLNRNQAQKSVDWQFTTADARIRLKRLYPQFEN